MAALCRIGFSLSAFNSSFPREPRQAKTYLTGYCGRATSTGKVAVAGLILRRTSLVHNFSVSNVRKPFSKSQTAQNK